jgi:hypothetical protein
MIAVLSILMRNTFFNEVTATAKSDGGGTTGGVSKNDITFFANGTEKNVSPELRIKDSSGVAPW